MERSETKKIKTVAEQIEMRYRKLLIYLDGRVSEIDHIRFMAKIYLTPRELSSEKFLDICSNLETIGQLGPHDLDLMKEFFPEQKDKDAYSAIVKAEMDIAGHAMPVRITTTKINPHTVSVDKILTAIKTSFEKDMEIISESSLSHKKRTKDVKRSTRVHKKAFKLFKKMHDHCNQNGSSVSYMDTGSLRLFFRFYSRQGIERFQEMYHSGELLATLQSGLITEELLEECGVQAVILDVEISDEDIKLCLEKIGDEIDTDNTAPSATNKNVGNEYEQRKVESQSAQLSNIDKLPVEPAECPDHQQNRIAFICLNPRCQYAFLCKKCIDENHKTHVRKDIAQFANEKKEILQARTAVGHERILASLKQEIVSTEDRILENRSKTTAEQEKIFQQCKEMKDELDKIAVTYSSACQTTGDANEKKLLSHLECLRTLFTEYESELLHCEETLANGSPCDIILIEKAGSPTPPDKPKPPETIILEFISKMISSNQLQDFFGVLVPLMVQPSMEIDDILKPCQEDNTITPIISLQNIQCVTKFRLDVASENRCDSVHPLSDGIFIWFHTSNNLLLVNKFGHITKNICLRSEKKNTELIDIAFSHDIIWTLDAKGCLQQIKTDGTLGHSFTHTKHCYSLHALRNDLLIVGMKGRVQILTLAGMFVRTLSTKRICNNTVSIVQCPKTGNLVFSDYEQLAVLNENLEKLYTIHGQTVKIANGTYWKTGYQDEGKFQPTSVSFDENGNLLVIDQGNSRVIMFDSIGQYVRTIVDNASSKEIPCAISATTGGTLWIAYEDKTFCHIKYK